MVSCRDLKSVDVQIHISRDVRQLKAMVVFLGIDLPEQEPATTAAARNSHQCTVAQPFQPPDNAAGDPFRNLLTFDRAGLQID